MDKPIKKRFIKDGIIGMTKGGIYNILDKDYLKSYYCVIDDDGDKALCEKEYFEDISVHEKQFIENVIKFSKEYKQELEENEDVENGKIVICHDNDILCNGELTIGKAYHVIEEDERFYKIINDNNNKCEYFKTRFHVKENEVDNNDDNDFEPLKVAFDSSLEYPISIADIETEEELEVTLKQAKILVDDLNKVIKEYEEEMSNKINKGDVVEVLSLILNDEYLKGTVINIDNADNHRPLMVEIPADNHHERLVLYVGHDDVEKV